jgi:phosphatidylinositol alpha-mannosyltransferase
MMGAMRVAVFSPFSLARPGGVQGQVLGLGRALRDLGIDARVYAPCDGAPPEVGVTMLGRSIPVAANGSVAPIAPDPAAQLRTLRALRAEQPDVIHLHEPFAPGPNWTVILATRLPTVATFHSAGHHMYLPFRPLCRWAGRSRFAAIAAVSEAARLTTEHELGRPVQVLANGVTIDHFAKADPWPTERPAVLFVGRHEPRKGLRVLLDAFAGLEHEADLWVVGLGPETDELRRRDQPGVQWLGEVSDVELARRMKAATVFCAPSLHGESFGVVLLEAMAAGTPVVASDLPGYAKVGRQGREALLVTPGDAAQLGAAINRVLGDAALGARLVEGGRLRADDLSMDRLAEIYVDKYERVIRQRAR